jgi:hypothetical protein
MKNQTGLLSYPFLEERIHHHIFRHRCQAPMAEVLLLWRRCCCCGGGASCCGGGAAAVAEEDAAVSEEVRERMLEALVHD